MWARRWRSEEEKRPVCSLQHSLAQKRKKKLKKKKKEKDDEGGGER